MTTIKCRKCGKVYPFNEKICPDCGYDIRKDETLSPRDRVALGLKSDSALFEELGKEKYGTLEDPNERRTFARCLGK